MPSLAISGSLDHAAALASGDIYQTDLWQKEGVSAGPCKNAAVLDFADVRGGPLKAKLWELKLKPR